MRAPAFALPPTTALALLCLTSTSASADPPSILNNTSHIVWAAHSALNVLGIPHETHQGPSSTTLALNQTCPGSCTSFLPWAEAISQARDTSRTQFAAGSHLTVTPAVPYQVINQSSKGYTLRFDQLYYSSLTEGGIVYSAAYCGTPQAGDYPPVAFVTVLPNTSRSMGIGLTGCGYAQGIELSIAADSSDCQPNCRWTPIPGGGSIDVSSPSATTEAMSAVLAALKFNHPDWTWGDVKSVLRTTASNWTSGYVPFNPEGPAYGYGNIDYSSANAYSGTILLQPPGFSVRASGPNAVLTLYPFMTSRRAGEVVYSYAQRPALPHPCENDEYTYAQVVSLANQFGGELIYNSAGVAGVQTIEYTPRAPAKRFFVAFTVDDIIDLSSARFSRAEEFLIQSVDFE